MLLTERFFQGRRHPLLLVPALPVAGDLAGGHGEPFAVLGSLDDINGSKMLRRVVNWLSERGQQLEDNQLGDIVLMEPQDHRYFG